MIGTAGVNGLQIDCIVGVYEHERLTPQRVVIDVELDYDFAAAARTDAIDEAVNYAAVAEQVSELVQRRKFQLIETMAEETTLMIFAAWPAVVAIRLTIRKPAAIPAAQSSFVRVERTRS